MTAVNLSDNSNQSMEHAHKEPLDESDIILITAFSIILFIGVVGNVLVIYVCKFETSKKLSTMESLILRLAIIDLLGSICNPALFVYWQVTHNRAWHFGTVGCKMLPTLLNFTDSVSIGIIIIIALDRCRVICKPFLRGYSTTQINIAFLVVLFTAIFLEIPRIIHAEVVPKHTCYVPDSEEPSYAYPALLSLLLRDVLSIAIFLVIFPRMYRVLYDTSTKGLLGDRTQLKKRKAFILLVVITIVFMVLVFPRDILHIAFLTISLIPDTVIYPSKLILNLNTILKILRAINSIINVFIYARLHGKFRKKFGNVQTSINRKRHAAIRKISQQSNVKRYNENGSENNKLRENRDSIDTTVI